MTYSGLLPKDVAGGFRPSYVAVGMALSLEWPKEKLVDFASAYTRYRINLQNDKKLCHTLSHMNPKRELTVSISCSRSHKGQRPPLVKKTRERKQSHHCQCKFSFCFTKKARFKNPHREGNQTILTLS